MVSVTHLEFAYTQAPKKLKSLVMCTYLLGISLGNLFTAGVNFFAHSLTGSKAGAPSEGNPPSYFFFFVIVMAVTGILFLFFARFYKGNTYIQDEAQPEPA
jgi:POT family proton-dependent oligopeptide transporter